MTFERAGTVVAACAGITTALRMQLRQFDLGSYFVELPLVAEDHQQCRTATVVRAA